jgi:two-component system response regulator RegA
VVDLKMPGGTGLELVKALHEIDPATKIVVLTGYGSIATAIDAIRLGATYYLSKPADADDIVAAFARGEAPPLAPRLGHRLQGAPSLARAEWEHINRVLSDCAGNISEAARRLGIHRRSLQRKLQKYPPNK